MVKPYFERDGIVIYHGDCREILPGLTADSVVTDPPYGLEFNYLSYDDSIENLRGLILDVFPLMRTATQRQFVMCGPTQITEYPRADWVMSVTWNTTGSFGKYGYNQWTPVLCFGSDLAGFGNVNGMTKGDVLRINGGGGVGFNRSEDERKHTCPKPVTMMRPVIQRLTSPGETILDPFMGSGTTLRVAADLGRRAIGIEIEERYCEIAARRLDQMVLPLEVTA